MYTNNKQHTRHGLREDEKTQKRDFVHTSTSFILSTDAALFFVVHASSQPCNTNHPSTIYFLFPPRFIIYFFLNLVSIFSVDLWFSQHTYIIIFHKTLTLLFFLFSYILLYTLMKNDLSFFNLKMINFYLLWILFFPFFADSVFFFVWSFCSKIETMLVVVSLLSLVHIND